MLFIYLVGRIEVVIAPLENVKLHKAEQREAENRIYHRRISNVTISEFYVMLTVHLGIIFVNNQLDAQFFFIYVYFYSAHVSDSHVPIIRRIKLYQYDIWYMSLCVHNRLVCRSICSFLFCKCFGQPCAHHQENQIVSIRHLVYITICR